MLVAVQEEPELWGLTLSDEELTRFTVLSVGSYSCVLQHMRSVADVMEAGGLVLLYQALEDAEPAIAFAGLKLQCTPLDDMIKCAQHFPGIFQGVPLLGEGNTK